MKKMRSYRLSEQSLGLLAEIRRWYPEWSDTEIIEKAIEVLNAIEYKHIGDFNNPNSLRFMNGERFVVIENPN